MAEGQLQIAVPLLARLVAHAAAGVVAPWYQARVGEEVAIRGEALDVVDLQEDGEGVDLPQPRDPKQVLDRLRRKELRQKRALQRPDLLPQEFDLLRKTARLKLSEWGSSVGELTLYFSRSRWMLFFALVRLETSVRRVRITSRKPRSSGEIMCASGIRSARSR